MKEMLYQPEKKIEVLYNGIYKGYEFYILNLGTHPTAYVNVKNNVLLNKKNYDDIDINVHGGLTYSEDHLWIENKKEIKGWFIGWDYAHAGDFSGYYFNFNNFISTLKLNKQWTTEEIYEDVKSVIEQCIIYGTYKDKKRITMIDLFNLIEKDDAPKHIKVDNKIAYYINGDYYNIKNVNNIGNIDLFYDLGKEYSFKEILKLEVEILNEEDLKNELKKGEK